ncbi:MAG: hypothetical protein SCH71_13330 [Desulfobulbaceae bacterium]|nr:hypothetical protein [Desulfobulbaceae bacterium]
MKTKQLIKSAILIFIVLFGMDCLAPYTSYARKLIMPGFETEEFRREKARESADYNRYLNERRWREELKYSEGWNNFNYRKNRRSLDIQERKLNLGKPKSDHRKRDYKSKKFK